LVASLIRESLWNHTNHAHFVYRVVSDRRLEDETLRHRLARRTTAARAS
jgi:hypothetical protein